MTNKALHLLDTLREFLHIAAHFLGCNLRIDLRRADAAVSQHLRERFDRYVVRQADRRGIGMAAHVPRYVFLDTASLRYGLNAVLAVIVTRNGQEPSVGCHIAVLFDDMLGDVQQPDIGFGARFLTVGIQPQMPVERGLQIRLGKVCHIRPAQSRKGAEDEQVANQRVTRLLERPVDQESDFIFGQKVPFGLLFRDVVREKRIALQQAVIDGHIDNLPKRHHIRPDRVVAVVLFHSQEQLEVRDECRSKLFERNVADLIPLFDELREVFVHDSVFPIAAQAFEFADLLLVILVMLAEYGEQRLVVHAQS